jgi:hypothetical protein
VVCMIARAAHPTCSFLIRQGDEDQWPILRLDPWWL